MPLAPNCICEQPISFERGECFRCGLTLDCEWVDRTTWTLALRIAEYLLYPNRRMFDGGRMTKGPHTP